MAVLALQDLWCNVVGSSLDDVFVESSWDSFLCEFTWALGCSNKAWKLGFWNLGKLDICLGFRSEFRRSKSTGTRSASDLLRTFWECRVGFTLLLETLEEQVNLVASGSFDVRPPKPFFINTTQPWNLARSWYGLSLRVCVCVFLDLYVLHIHVCRYSYDGYT